MYFKEFKIKDDKTKKERRIFFAAMLGEPDETAIENQLFVDKPKRQVLYTAYDVTEAGYIDKKAYEDGARGYLEEILRSDGLIPMKDTLDAEDNSFRKKVVAAYQKNKLKKFMMTTSLDKLEEKGALDIAMLNEKKLKDDDELRHIIAKR